MIRATDNHQSQRGEDLLMTQVTTPGVLLMTQAMTFHCKQIVSKTQVSVS